VNKTGQNYILSRITLSNDNRYSNRLDGFDHSMNYKHSQWQSPVNSHHATNAYSLSLLLLL